MISRREFLQASVAASAIVGISGFGNWSKLSAQQALTQDQLLQFDHDGRRFLVALAHSLVPCRCRAGCLPRARIARDVPRSSVAALPRCRQALQPGTAARPPALPPPARPAMRLARAVNMTNSIVAAMR